MPPVADEPKTTSCPGGDNAGQRIRGQRDAATAAALAPNAGTPAPHQTTPRDLYALPYAKRRAYERAISAYLNPANPRDVSMAEGAAFVRGDEWPRLHAALDAALFPRGEVVGADIVELFRVMKQECVLHD